jgi:RNA polymerase sigma factor (sigma-70 family)
MTVPDTLHPDPEQLATWLQATAQGDAAAFRALYDTISPKLFGYALRILGKRELAEEALQDGFVAIWNGAAGYQRHLAAPMTWMTTIVRNKSLDLLRRCAHDLDIDGPVFDAEIMAALQDRWPCACRCSKARTGKSWGWHSSMTCRTARWRSRWRYRSVPSRPGSAVAWSDSRRAW